MSATSMAGRVMDAADDDGSGGFRQQETALALRAGWRPAADGAGRDGDTWPWSPDLHVPGAAEWCAGRCRLREDAWPSCVEPDGALHACEYRPVGRPRCRPAIRPCLRWVVPCCDTFARETGRSAARASASGRAASPAAPGLEEGRDPCPPCL